MSSRYVLQLSILAALAMMCSCGNTFTVADIHGCGGATILVNEEIPVELEFCERGVKIDSEMKACAVVEWLRVNHIPVGSGALPPPISQEACAERFYWFRPLTDDAEMEENREGMGAHRSRPGDTNPAGPAEPMTAPTHPDQPPPG